LTLPHGLKESKKAIINKFENSQRDIKTQSAYELQVLRSKDA
jgi:hypothetical protein